MRVKKQNKKNGTFSHKSAKDLDLSIPTLLKINVLGAGEIAYWLRTLVALPEKLGTIPSTSQVTTIFDSFGFLS